MAETDVWPQNHKKSTLVSLCALLLSMDFNLQPVEWRVNHAADIT